MRVDDVRAFGGEFQRNGATDTTSGAGDDGDLVGELTHDARVVLGFGNNVN